ncbi:4Fe-4S dicluster domain-containing protein [Kluyvera intermedia]|uniref:4Fe-4S dicluster domain-containing protein n=1 Tax=Kluyvera intermedia TaxID=61648 RepID=UPI001F39A914|nr:4Fe-4S dicluster domain-containing protein [Kluyvera intermedia]EKU4732434.1 4Fe-4S dicluster domain-containing protein [Kluyvera ascorbata]MCE9890524.1 4Fe-4S dicluster domain-containing protein [Kluyvera intermedia]
MTHFILADADACIGCRTCEVACALEHSTDSSPFAPRLTVLRLDTVSVPAMCHQCENAPCVAACPVGALGIGSERVEANSSACIGCQSCVIACPFGAISIGAAAEIVKCDLCYGRERGPACVDVCPTSALRKITENELRTLQQQRQRATVF